MSSDPHAPTPAGPDPDEVASVVADTGTEPVDAVTAPAPEPATPADEAIGARETVTGADDPIAAREPVTAPDETIAAREPITAAADDPIAAPEPVTAPDPFDAQSSVTPADPDGASTVVTPPEPAFTPPAPVVTPPDPVVATPSAFTPPGTPQADGPAAQAAALAEKPEVQVGLAFLGGAVLTFVLKRFGR